MADIYELRKKYQGIPIELKTQKRWICFAVRSRNGSTTKIPVSPVEGKQGASSEDPSAWDTFENAIQYCADNNLDGVGFEFDGSEYIGIDLKNNKDDNGDTYMSEHDFREMTNDFVKTLNSYTEWSVSKNGIHIIIKGKAPRTENENPNIEIHESNRYFAMTGNAVRTVSPSERSAELEVLIAKYGSLSHAALSQVNESTLGELESYTDEEVLERAFSSQNADKIKSLYNGDISRYPSLEEAKQALCNFLAFYSNCDAQQVDRLFRDSALFDEQWDYEYDKVIQKSVETCAAIIIAKKSKSKEVHQVDAKPKNQMNLDEDGNPIFRYDKDIVKRHYSLDDTGNARMFYDLFGENFHWNADDKLFMFWTGKTWVYDVKEIIRKYANKFVEILKEDLDKLRADVENEGNEDRRKRLERLYVLKDKNVKHISNKSGKDAMLNEFRSMGKVSIRNSELNTQPHLLNTDSGIVDLRDGSLHPFDQSLLMSLNTNCKVSFEKPQVWDKFIHEVLDYGDPETTQQVVDCFQMTIGYMATGYRKDQYLFIANGEGSNGKSTAVDAIMDVLGDYTFTMDSSQLMVSKGNQSVQVQNTMAELDGKRLVRTSETEEGERLSEKTIKEITGEKRINAQKKFGRPYILFAIFKILMLTNHLPIIRDRGFSIWRRIFIFSFNRIFQESEMDLELPNKLMAEYDRILGWIIQGSVAYHKQGRLIRPEALLKEVVQYRQSIDTVFMFMESECYEDHEKGTPKNALYEAYVRYCSSSKLPSMSKPKFENDMASKGYKLVTGESQSQFYDGVCLRNPTTPSFRQTSSVFDD